MNRWRPNMCVDARSRRLFRAALGAAQLRELLLVWPDRHDFFVSGGVMLQPEITYEYIGASNNIVTASVVTVLLALHALAASGLLLGLWPRSCAIISFALQLWRIHQNDEVACTDSNLLAMGAIWAALMRYSALGKEPARVDIASLGPVVMLSCMYAASAQLSSASGSDPNGPFARCHHPVDGAGPPSSSQDAGDGGSSARNPVSGSSSVSQMCAPPNTFF